MLKSIETLNFNDISINTSELIKNTEPIEKNDPIKTNDPVKGVNVYRFYHSDRGIHFYTPSVAERDQITGNPNWGYNYEGVAYQSISESGTQLFRFYHASKGYHFLTSSEEEANNVIKHSIGEGFDVVTGQGITASNNGWGYTYEGRSFRVSSEKTENTSTEVHRFYHAQRGVHFYSSSLEEVSSVIGHSSGGQYADNLDAALNAPLLENGWGYAYEGVAWYAI